MGARDQRGELDGRLCVRDRFPTVPKTDERCNALTVAVEADSDPGETRIDRGLIIQGAVNPLTREGLYLSDQIKPERMNGPSSTG